MLYAGVHFLRYFPLLIWNAICRRGSFVKVFSLTDFGCYMRGGESFVKLFSLTGLGCYGSALQILSCFWQKKNAFQKCKILIKRHDTLSDLGCYMRGALSRYFPLLIWGGGQFSIFFCENLCM